jgi:hypothetical protein
MTHATRTRRLARRAALVGLAAALAVPAAAQARDIWATDTQGNLHRFDSLFPSDLLDTRPITGLPSGVSIRGIDIRPANGELWGLGSDSRLYRINASTAEAGVVGTGFVPALSGTAFGFDFNPTVDRLRLVSDTGQNLRLNPNTGGIAGVDGNLNPGSPRVSAAAYTNSGIGSTFPTSTTLYVIDTNTNQLLVQNPPNAGTLVNGRNLGVDVGDNVGFDIAGPRNEAWIAATPAGGTGASLYRVDLATGAAQAQGPIGDGRATITSIAARQNLQVWPVGNQAPSLSIVRTTIQPKPGQRAAYIARALDPDGLIVSVEWDTDNDGQFDDATGFSARIPLQRGVSTIRARATDDAGARVVAQVRVRI